MAFHSHAVSASLIRDYLLAEIPDHQVPPAHATSLIVVPHMLSDASAPVLAVPDDVDIPVLSLLFHSNYLRNFLYHWIIIDVDHEYYVCLPVGMQDLYVKARSGRAISVNTLSCK